MRGSLCSPEVTIDMLNYRAFVIGEVKQPGAIPTCGRGGRVGRRLSPIARENGILTRGAGSPSGESQPADPSTIFHPGDVEVPQRFI